MALRIMWNTLYRAQSTKRAEAAIRISIPLREEEAGEKRGQNRGRPVRLYSLTHPRY